MAKVIVEVGDSAYSNLFILGLLIIGLAAAWFLGYRSRIGKAKVLQSVINQDYFVGLNYLLNDEPDDAVDVFIGALEVNSNTFETYMALGTLLRRRGKVDKSISVYQDLLARPQLSDNELDRIKVELVRSYIAAGLLDRAERLLGELNNAKTKVRIAALVQGAAVYQLEKDWSKAVLVMVDLIKLSPAQERKQYQTQASHYYCELSDQENNLGHYLAAKELLKNATQMDKNNVRVSILLGELEVRLGNYKHAIKAFEKVQQQDSSFVSEIFLQLLECYQHEGKEKHAKKYIDVCFKEVGSANILMNISEYIEEHSGKTKALDFLLEQLEKNPSLSLMNRAMFLARNTSDERGSDELFQQTLESYLSAKAMYQCNSCGYELKKLNWLCPGCGVWGDVKPS